MSGRAGPPEAPPAVRARTSRANALILAAALSVAAVILAAQLFVPPVVGLADNGDYERVMQYQLTAIEIHLDKDGKGEGKMQPAAKISWDAKEKKIELENYNALPIDLVNVKSKTP